MRAVVQRVKYARVKVDNKIIGEINDGFMVLLGIHENDNENDMKWLARKILSLRVFEDENHKMNLGIEDIKGKILVVSQFTLYGDCIKGRRPSFVEAARPEKAIPLYEMFVEECKKTGIGTEHGQFGADMKIELLNDGPVTLIIDTKNVKVL